MFLLTVDVNRLGGSFLSVWRNEQWKTSFQYQKQYKYSTGSIWPLQIVHWCWSRVHWHCTGAEPWKILGRIPSRNALNTEDLPVNQNYHNIFNVLKFQRSKMWSKHIDHSQCMFIWFLIFVYLFLGSCVTKLTIAMSDWYNPKHNKNPTAA